MNEIALIENINFISYYDKPENESPFTFVEAQSIEKKEQSRDNKLKITSPDYSQNPENIDEVIASATVNSYVEKELLMVTEINKGLRQEPELKPSHSKISKNEPHSFAEWLNAFKNKESVSVKADTTQFKREKKTVIAPEKSKQEAKNQLMEEIIKKEPRISKLNPDKNFYSAVENARSSVLEDENLVTETLAKIYALQGNYSKAIRAYEILCLKFPEKKSLFALQIEKLKAK